MADYQIDHASGVRLIGAEMMFQEELDRVGEVSVIVDLLSEVVATKQPERILLLGPRAALTLEELPRESAVDVLLRGLPDARTVAAQRMLHHTLSIWCGSIDRFEPGQKYDLIILLDEPSRLLTPDSRPLTHTEIFSRAASWLTPEGRMVTQFANAFSTESLLTLNIESPRLSEERYAYSEGELDDPPEIPVDDNEQWWRGSTGFPQQPLHWQEMDDAMRASGLEWAATYAAYPAHDHPAMLLNRDDVVPLQNVARAGAVRLQGELPSTQPYLQEPTKLVAEVIAAGQVVEMAPAWVLVLHNHEASAAELPAAILSDLGMDHRWRVSHLAVHDEDRYLWTTRASKGAVTTSGLLSRRLNAPFRVPGGENFGQLLRQALIGGNFDVIRRQVQEYVAWLEGLEPAEAIFAAPSNVSLDTVGFAVDDDSWVWAGEVDSLTAAVYCMRYFALRALRAGVAHPWRPDISPDDMTKSLMAMAGRGIGEEVIAKAAHLDAEIQALMLDVPTDAREQFIADSVADGKTSVSAAIGGGMGFRDLAARTARLSIALQTRAEQVAWLETSLRNRTTRMNKSDKLVESIRNSVSFRLGQTITWPVRRPIAMARERVVDMIPRDLINKGIAALKSRREKEQ